MNKCFPLLLLLSAVPERTLLADDKPLSLSELRTLTDDAIKAKILSHELSLVPSNDGTILTLPKLAWFDTQLSDEKKNDRYHSILEPESFAINEMALIA